MNNFENIVSLENNSCCPKITVYSEDFYMIFGNCQKSSHDCACANFGFWKNVLAFLKNPV